MSLKKYAVLGLLAPSIVALAQPAQAQETSVGPPLVVDSSLSAVTMEDEFLREDAGSRVAIAAGQDGAVVAWIGADNMFGGALLAPDGSIVQSPSFELPSTLTQNGRLFGAYGGGRYLFVSHGTDFGAGSAPSELFILDEQGALLDSTQFDIGECVNGAPTYDGSLFLVPCSSWIVAIDASQLAITSFSLTAPLQQPTHGVSCNGASCLAASWYYAADPETNIQVERFSSSAGTTPIGLGFSDSQLRMLAVTGAEDDAFLVLAQCQLSPCGDPDNGVAIDNLVGYRVESDDSFTPLDVVFSGEGLTSPRLASNGQSIGVAWRQTSGAHFGTLTRRGESRGESVALNSGYVSSISLAHMSTYGYLAAYDEGANVIVRAISTDPGDAEPPPEDEDPGTGGSGAADNSDKKATDDEGSCSFTPRPSSGSWAWLLLGAAWMVRRLRSRRAAR